MNDVSIIEFPSNLGLKKPIDQAEPGVKKLPGWLNKYKFHDLIKPQSIIRLNPPAYSMDIDEVSRVRNADDIVQYAKEQAEVLQKLLLKKTFLIVIGGDCSILIGNMLALKKTGKYGLFFLDGHTDFMLPALSQTKAAAGMDLAIVTGYGHNKLTNIDGLKPYVDEQFVCCAGNREYDPEYVKQILNSKIKYYDLLTLRQTGILNCVSDFLTMISLHNLDGFWIHIDVDVLNDEIMPAVDSREKDGLSYEEMDQILQPLLSNSKAIGLEITILDPDLDATGILTKAFVNSFCKSFNEARKIVANKR